MRNKNKATDEQKARAAERRERFAALCKTVAEMSDEARAELVKSAGAVLTCEGLALSPRNTMLLLLQRRGVSVVGGFRQWRAEGRYVRKGERSLSIWIPRGGSSEGAADPDKREGEISSRELGERQRFLVGSVFDISQTAEAGADDIEGGGVGFPEVVATAEAEGLEVAAAEFCGRHIEGQRAALMLTEGDNCTATAEGFACVASGVPDESRWVQAVSAAHVEVLPPAPGERVESCLWGKHPAHGGGWLKLSADISGANVRKYEGHGWETFVGSCGAAVPGRELVLMLEGGRE